MPTDCIESFISVRRRKGKAQHEGNYEEREERTDDVVCRLQIADLQLMVVLCSLFGSDVRSFVRDSSKQPKRNIDAQLSVITVITIHHHLLESEVFCYSLIKMKKIPS
jgi:hypothetical protein